MGAGSGSKAREVVDTSTGEAFALVTTDAAKQFSMQQYLGSVTTDSAFANQQALAKAYDGACRALIGADDIQMDGDRAFKKKSAWRKLSRHFAIDTRVVSHEFKDVPVPSDRFEVGSITVAEVIVEATAPWGQSAQAIGACGYDEEVGRRTITLADMVATAETRATNRAISNLIAMGEVSADEITRGQHTGASAPAQGGNRYESAAPAARTSGGNGGRKTKPFNPDEKVGFGKHKALTWRQLADSNAEYVEWLISSNAEKPDNDQYKRGAEWVDALNALIGKGQSVALHAGAPADSDFGPLSDGQSYGPDYEITDADLPW